MGDVTGRIVLWHGVGAALRSRLAAGRAQPATDLAEATSELKLARTTVHWHAEPVCCLAFSGDGTYLLSGGQRRCSAPAFVPP